MKIQASIVEAHRFVRVRRRGYDPVEVDRVMERLAATLRSYEEETAELQSRVRDADESVDAIRRTFVAAQRTSEEMIRESSGRAAVILQQARTEAERLISNARTEVEAMVFERDEAVVHAHQVGAERMAEAEAEAFELLLDAESARSDALAGTERIHASTREEAEETRRSILAEAERHANEIVGAAGREEIRLVERLAQLRGAVADVERRINDLAALTASRTAHIAEVIDLTTIEDDTAMLGSGRN